MCFFDLGDSDDSKWSCCCGAVHIYVGLYCFLVQDVFIMIIMSLSYYGSVMAHVYMTNLVPFIAFLISWIFVLIGIYGFVRRRPLPVRLYAWRTLIVSAFCAIWTYILFQHVEGGFGNTLVGIVWLVGAPTYLYGSYIARRTANWMRSNDFDFGEPAQYAAEHDSDRDTSTDESDDEKDQDDKRKRSVEKVDTGNVTSSFDVQQTTEMESATELGSLETKKTD